MPGSLSSVIVIFLAASLCDGVFLSRTELACPQGGSITRAEYCEETPRCANGEDSDTIHPRGPCIKVGEGPLDYRFDCGSSEDSVPLDAMCNGSVDCGNGNDEKNEFCPAHGLKSSGRVVSIRCVPTCLNGGDCKGGLCECTSQWKGDYCQIPVCRPECKNGGTCSEPNTCLCPLTWTGSRCQAFVCSPPCSSGKVCTFHGTCEYQNTSGDPYFLVNLPNDSRLCFSLQGEHELAFNLISSKTLVINALFFKAPSKLKHLNTVIGEIGLLYGDNEESAPAVMMHFDFQDESIYVTGYGLLHLHQVAIVILNEGKADVVGRNITHSWDPYVLVSVEEKLNFVVWFNHDKLDLKWSKVHSLTQPFHGIIGQFFNKGTKIDKKNRQLVLPKRSPIPVNLEDPKPEVHHKSQCWRPQTPGYQGEGLIEGDYVEYVVSSVFATDFKYSLL